MTIFFSSISRRKWRASSAHVRRERRGWTAATTSTFVKTRTLSVKMAAHVRTTTPRSHPCVLVNQVIIRDCFDLLNWRISSIIISDSGTSRTYLHVYECKNIISIWKWTKRADTRCPSTDISWALSGLWSPLPMLYNYIYAILLCLTYFWLLLHCVYVSHTLPVRSFDGVAAL